MNLWILRLIMLVVTLMSPELRKGLEDVINGLETQAKNSENPWDDIIVNLLRTLLFNQR